MGKHPLYAFFYELGYVGFYLIGLPYTCDYHWSTGCPCVEGKNHDFYARVIKRDNLATAKTNRRAS